MRRYLLPEGKQYKVNLHCHTTVSDGTLSPAEIKKRYQEKGYHAVAFTDHEILIPHDDLTDENFVALHGFEAALKDGLPEVRTGTTMRAYHFCFIAKRSDNLLSVGFHPAYVTQGNAPMQIPFARYTGSFFPREYSPECATCLVCEANARGFLVTYNHPRWSLQNYSDYKDIEGLFGVEVYNTDTAPLGDSNAAVYEDILRTGKRLLPIAADDNHGETQMFGGFEMVVADTLSYDSLTDALSRGDAYASQSPLIEALYVEDGKICIETTPAVSVTLLTDTRYVRSATELDGGTLCRASFSLPTDVSYVRFEVRDREGKMAWTRAYDIEELI